MTPVCPLTVTTSTSTRSAVAVATEITPHSCRALCRLNTCDMADPVPVSAKPSLRNPGHCGWLLARIALMPRSFMHEFDSISAARSSAKAGDERRKSGLEGVRASRQCSPAIGEGGTKHAVVYSGFGMLGRKGSVARASQGPSFSGSAADPCFPWIRH